MTALLTQDILLCWYCYGDIFNGHRERKTRTDFLSLHDVLVYVPGTSRSSRGCFYVDVIVCVISLIVSHFRCYHLA